MIHYLTVAMAQFHHASKITRNKYFFQALHAFINTINAKFNNIYFVALEWKYWFNQMYKLTQGCVFFQNKKRKKKKQTPQILTYFVPHLQRTPKWGSRVCPKRCWEFYCVVRTQAKSRLLFVRKVWKSF